MKHYTEEQLAEFKEAFGLFDKNGDGTISETELKKIMDSLGKKLTTAEVHTMMLHVDTNKNGTIDFQEFLQLMERKTTAGDKESELRDAFNLFDKNGDGFISAEELKSVMKSVGENMGDTEVEQMIKEADLDGDGKINYTEFVRMLKC